eukprot:CAMPEP_0183298406 /NCGR_PEP_ID=MMETSP0160_2-20130417/5441_1 /TAXON_ID=2839 ORGANISM="Odontella Sinensis, Strain Grunow 1884" /NCGR_SAMPLE_ID=MMETSP0160_2 /ASSEMBLY_ACC=CAM_ASM_000250 /LENGTH=249 /DNA_ID=CAMNT_0025460435 /DNA_START=166 /DNA_END=915 /DNA_ORIENTATION=+
MPPLAEQDDPASPPQSPAVTFQADSDSKAVSVVTSSIRGCLKGTRERYSSHNTLSTTSATDSESSERSGSGSGSGSGGESRQEDGGGVGGGSVRWSIVEIRDYERVKGDHETLLGCPLSIGWKYWLRDSHPTLDEYEENRGPRRYGLDLFKAYHDRTLLIKNFKPSAKEKAMMMTKKAGGLFSKKSKGPKSGGGAAAGAQQFGGDMEGDENEAKRRELGGRQTSFSLPKKPADGKKVRRSSLSLLRMKN